MAASDRRPRAGARGALAGLTSVLAIACVPLAPDAPEPLDGGAAYRCGSRSLPCCHARRCDDGSRCVAHAPGHVEAEAYTHEEALVADLPGMSKDVVLFGACPGGGTRVGYSIERTAHSGDPHCVGDWVSPDDPTDCRVAVHFGLRSFESIGCRVRVTAMMPDPSDPPTRCVDPSMPLPEPVCGNGWVERGEQCDDGTTTGLGTCDGSCQAKAFCGDGRVDAPEGCDDGDRDERDGCSSTCVVEVCGNGVLDPGEGCEGAGCGAACGGPSGCGDATPGAGEGCDDGDTTSLDGCSSSCRVEHGLVMTGLRLADPLATPSARCDFGGDGLADAVLNSALGIFGAFFGTATRPLFETPPHPGILLSGALGDVTSFDGPVRLATLALDDVDGDASNDLSGSAALRIRADARDGDVPTYSQACTLAGGSLVCAGGTFRIPMVNGVVALLERATLRASFDPAAGVDSARLVGDAAGLCGVLPVRLFVSAPDVFGDFGAMSPGTTVPLTPCAEGLPRSEIWLADVVLSGALKTADGLPLIEATQPDVDLDGDGLEAFVVVPSTTSCQGSIAACIDGDGTVVEGHDCARDPRFADGWSVAGVVSAVPFRITP